MPKTSGDFLASWNFNGVVNPENWWKTYLGTYYRLFGRKGTQDILKELYIFGGKGIL